MADRFGPLSEIVPELFNAVRLLAFPVETGE
jgi:hypothetical protein